MALRRAQDTGNTSTFKFEKKGDVLKGYYVKTTEEVINGSPAKKHWFSTKTGVVTVLGQANMYKQLVDNDVKEMYVEITYTGNTIKLKGGKTMKCYLVDFNPEDRYTGQMPAEESEDDYADDITGDADPIDDEPQEAAPPARPVAPRAPAPAPDASRAAKVQELLNRGRNKSA